jgi:hypothetical protein
VSEDLGGDAVSTSQHQTPGGVGGPKHERILELRAALGSGMRALAANTGGLMMLLRKVKALERSYKVPDPKP